MNYPNFPPKVSLSLLDISYRLLDMSRLLASSVRSSAHTWTSASRAHAVRHASSGPKSAPRRFISGTILLASGVAFGAYYFDSRSMMHEHIAMPLMRLVDPEQGHRAAVKLLGNRWFRPTDKGVDGPELQAEVSEMSLHPRATLAELSSYADMYELFGLPISNPVGMAAGFDKDGEAIDGLFDLGFGYVEIGSVTPQPQVSDRSVSSAFIGRQLMDILAR